MKKLINLMGILQVVVMACASQPLRQAQDRPNVIFVIFDDLGSRLACYGNPHTITPNFDSFAESGVRFDNMFCQQSICSASRASFLTGVRPNVTGVDFPYTKWFVKNFLPKHPAFTRYFFENGYAVKTYGKIHHGPTLDGQVMMHEDFSEPWVDGNKPRYALAENRRLEKNRAIKTKGKIRTDLPSAFECADVGDFDYMDGDIARQVIEDLGRFKELDKPFFLGVGFWLPHIPYNAPKKYWDLYDPDQIECFDCTDYPEGSYKWSHAGNRTQRKDGSWELRGGTAAQAGKKYSNPPNNRIEGEYAKKLLQGYYASVSYCDALFGKIIDEVKRLGLWEDTVVVVASDHGYHLGEHNCWTKWNLCEFDTQVPFIMRVPGRKSLGEPCDKLVEMVDLFPTFCDLAGLEKPDYLEGASFLPLFDDAKQLWKKAAFSNYQRNFHMKDGVLEGSAMRTEDYRYIEWRKKSDNTLVGTELYDRKKDPFEMKNVARSLEYRETLKQHATMMEQGWKQCLPPGVVNHSSNAQGDESQYGYE